MWRRLCGSMCVLLSLAVPAPAHETTLCHNRLFVHGDIRHETINPLLDVMANCAPQDQRDATIVIDSPGGQLAAALTIHKTIRAHPQLRRLTTLGSQNVHSAAVVLFLAGEERLLHCEATMLLHSHRYRFTTLGEIPHKQLMSSCATSQELHDEHVQIIAARTHLNLHEVERLLDAEVTITASEALALGFATRLVGDCAQ